jgi:4'-phosphopantetheinyl transferase
VTSPRAGCEADVGVGVTVHVLGLAVGEREGARLARLLSTGERRRAARFRFPIDRVRFVAARAGLRAVLADHARVPAADLRFGYGSHGKPWLRTMPDLRFNLSHARDLAVVAVARRCDVGIDLEPLDGARDLADVARRFFSPAENAALAALPAALRAAELARVWCRKEAYAKARGLGLALPLHTFDVAVGPVPRPRTSLLIATRPHPADARAWELHDLAVASGFVAALATAVPRAPEPNRAGS